MSRRYAVISDIHGNVHALIAVLREIESLRVDGVICLGDIVGYGPSPADCLDLVSNYCQVAIRGNHEDALLDPDELMTFNGVAQSAIHWTRQRLQPRHVHAITRMPAVAGLDDLAHCVHDCPVPAPMDYVHDKYIAAAAFQGFDRPICLLGHTHVPLVFESPALDPDQKVEPMDIQAYLANEEYVIELQPDRRYICNPGSVGQPRDGDPRASFAVLDFDRRTFGVHRVEYDIEAVQLATRQAGLPPVLAERLAIGA